MDALSIIPYPLDSRTISPFPLISTPLQCVGRCGTARRPDHGGADPALLHLLSADASLANASDARAGRAVQTVQRGAERDQGGQVVRMGTPNGGGAGTHPRARTALATQGRTRTQVDR